MQREILEPWVRSGFESCSFPSMNDTQSIHSELSAYYASSVLSADTIDTFKHPGTSSHGDSTTALLRHDPKSSARFSKRDDESPEYYDYPLTENPRHGQKDELKGNLGWAVLRLANPRFSPSAPSERKPQSPTYLAGEKISASVLLGPEKRPGITSIQLVASPLFLLKLHLVLIWSGYRESCSSAGQDVGEAAIL